MKRMANMIDTKATSPAPSAKSPCNPSCPSAKAAAIPTPPPSSVTFATSLGAPAASVGRFRLLSSFSST